jgi:hypothetical protein
MSATSVVTHIRGTVRRAKRILKLSAILRYSLATAAPDPAGKPSLLPTEIPKHCAHNLFRCRKSVRWIVGDGQNHVFMCSDHYDGFWEGRDTKDFTVERTGTGKYFR